MFGITANTNKKDEKYNPFADYMSPVPEAQFTAVSPAQLQKENSTHPLLLTSSIHTALNNKDTTILEDAASVFKFAIASGVSAAAQMYDILPTIGNALGGDFDYADTDSIMQAIDSDLEQYYSEHKQGVDTVGFILGSIVPGMQGIKVLNAGQRALTAAARSGKVGKLQSGATKLLAPDPKTSFKEAVKAVTTSHTRFSLQEANLMKTLGKNLHQNVLEAAAFEGMVLATMNQSPVLKEQDIGDMMSHLAWGTAIGGVIGGAIAGAGTVYGVKRAIKEANIQDKPWTEVIPAGKGISDSDAIIHYSDQIAITPEVPKNISEEKAKFLTDASNAKKKSLEAEMRTRFLSLTNGDAELGNQLFLETKIMGADKVLDNYLGTTTVARLNDISVAERRLIALKKILSTGDKKKLAKLNLDDVAKAVNTEVSYQVHFGEDMGQITLTAPTPVRMADTLKKGESIQIKDNTVTAGKESWKFTKITPKTIDRYDITQSSVMEADARRLWLKSHGALPEDKVIYSRDLPMLEHAYNTWTGKVNVMFKDNTTYRITDKDELLTLLSDVKADAYDIIRDRSFNGTIYNTPEAAVAKLKQLTGLHLVPADATEIGATTIGDYVTLSATGTPRIRMNKKYLVQLPIEQLLDTVKHEQGHSIFDVLLSIGGIPATKRKTIQAEIEKASRLQRPGHWKSADESGDYSYVKYTDSSKDSGFADHEMMADAFAYFSKFPEKMQKMAPEFFSEFGHLIHPLGKDVVAKYVRQAQHLDNKELAAMLNVRESYLNKSMVSYDESARDILAIESYAEDYTSALKKAGAIKENAGTVKVWNMPQHSRMITDTTPVKDLDNNILLGMSVIQQRAREYQSSLDTAFVEVQGSKWAQLLPDITADDMLRATSLGAERAFVTSASANYGTFASKIAYIGSIAHKMKIEASEQVTNALEAPLYALSQNPKAAIEFATLQAEVRAIPQEYTLNEAGDALIPWAVKKYEEAIAAGKADVKPPQLDPRYPDSFTITNKETIDAIKIHMSQNDSYRSNMQVLRAAQGATHAVKTDVFYPIPVDIRDFKHFATVTDDSIVGGSQSRMLYANTADQLQQMIDKVPSASHISVMTKGEAENYWKSIGKYEYEKTLHDSTFGTELNRKGVSAPYFVPTDPKKIVNDVLSWHKDRSVGVVMESLSAKYELAFEELKKLGEQFTNVETSTFGAASMLKYADEVVKNPYMDLVKTALDIKNHTDYPFWINANKLIDNKFTQMFSRVAQSFQKTRSAEDLDEINNILKQYGYKGPSYDMEMDLLANHTAPKGALTNFVRRSNAILAFTTLRSDVLNAVNNWVGSNVLLGAEAKSVIRAIERGDENAVGELAALAKIKVPGTDKEMLSASKLIANAYRDFNRTGADMQFYKDINVVTSISDQYRWVLDTLTLEGKETVRDLDSKIETVRQWITSGSDKVEAVTGNRLAEEFNRFVAAHVMKQLTDLAVKHKVMKPKDAFSYINTFVNRTQGNYLASQRPMLFQGPIGQAIGLFQTYQFNLMQQLLRHMGEGAKKDAATMLGLQGTIYGMNGLPAFNFINNHIVGTASGNTEHRDAYTTIYGAMNKDAADWLMYGAASNMLIDPDLKVNLYTRGDINPRHLSIVPTTVQDVPIYGAYSKFFGNIFNTIGQLGAGAEVEEVFLQGLEHNGISRPLAGIAQTLQGLTNPYGASYSTTNQGNVIAANDMVSLKNLARIVGGKPMSDAIATDAAYRLRAYSLADASRREKLGQVIKTKLIAGDVPSQEEVEDFAARYVEAGGRTDKFNQWMLQLYKSANEGQANKLARSLDSAQSQAMLNLMGGALTKDFTTPPTGQ